VSWTRRLVLAVLAAALFSAGVLAEAGAQWADSAARLQVTPRHAEVFVDGYRAGIVDDFDGLTQRLRVSSGEHVIDLYLDGYKPVTQTILFAPGQTYRLRYVMEPLAPGEPAPERPTPAARASAAPPAAPVIYDALGRPVAHGSAPPSAPAPAPAASTAAVLSIRVQPGDAVILVDGGRWQGSTSERLDVQVTPGTHRIDVQKDGYQPFTTSVDVRPGETRALNVSLTRSEGRW
jgi:hypothetical protein